MKVVFICRSLFRVVFAICILSLLALSACTSAGNEEPSPNNTGGGGTDTGGTDGGGTDGGGTDGGGTDNSDNLPRWIHPDVKAAWQEGYLGQGTNIHIVDNYKPEPLVIGDLGAGEQSLPSGSWAWLQAQTIAPLAAMAEANYNDYSAELVLYPDRLNVISWGRAPTLGTGNTPDGSLDALTAAEDWQSVSAINYAKEGEAVVVKAAGDFGRSITERQTRGEQYDLFAQALVGAPSAIFVGALNKHGSETDQASLSSYSNTPGENEAVQNQFLVVGVPSDTTGLSGTKYAAPIVSGYAAILGSKFTDATPAQISQQLLTTARTDTIKDYDRAVHGMGEASLSKALAPSSIQ